MQSMIQKSRCKRTRKSFVLWSGLFVCQTYNNAKWQLYVCIFSALIRPTNVLKSSLQSCNYWAHSPAYSNWSLLENWNLKEKTVRRNEENSIHSQDCQNCDICWFWNWVFVTCHRQTSSFAIFREKSPSLKSITNQLINKNKNEEQIQEENEILNST